MSNAYLPTLAPTEHGRALWRGGHHPLPALMVSSLNSLAWQVKALRSDPNSPASLRSFSQVASVPAGKTLTVPHTGHIVSHRYLSARGSTWSVLPHTMIQSTLQDQSQVTLLESPPSHPGRVQPPFL